MPPSLPESEYPTITSSRSRGDRSSTSAARAGAPRRSSIVSSSGTTATSSRASAASSSAASTSPAVRVIETISVSMHRAPRRAWSAAASARKARTSSGSSTSEREWSRRSSVGPWRPKTSRAPAQRGEAAVGDALAAVLTQARLHEVELGAQLLDVRVVVGAEPLPHRRQPPPVRLPRVRLLRQVDVGHGGSASTSVRDMPHATASSRTSRRSRSRTSAAPRSTASRTVAGPTFGFPSRSPPIQLPNRSGAGQPAAPRGEQIAGRVPQRVLDEPQPLPDLVDDAGPVGAHLVRLPEDRHLLREPRDAALTARGAAGRRARRAVPRGAGAAPGSSAAAPR